jgi:hypothetical protein
MGSISIGDLTALIEAGVAVAGVLGACITFVWVRVENVNKRTKAELAKCEERAVHSRERRSSLYTVIDFLCLALHRHEPLAPEIEKSRELITELRERDRVEAEQERN